MARQARAEMTRGKIIDAAVGLFEAVGYGDTDLTAIIKRAGVTKGAFYYHFEGKDQVADAIIDEGNARLRQAFANADRFSSSALQCLVVATFEVALSGDFRLPDGSAAYPSFDLGPLQANPDVRVRYVDPVDGVMPAAALEDVDALILLVPRFAATSVPKSGRLAVVARFGVGFDSVDVPVCTSNDIALVTTPGR